jgi:hypothetical protein
MKVSSLKLLFLVPIQRIEVCSRGFAPGPSYLSCLPRQGNPKEGTPRNFLVIPPGRPQYISGTRPLGSDSLKCFTLRRPVSRKSFEWGGISSQSPNPNRQPLPFPLPRCLSRWAKPFTVFHNLFPCAVYPYCLFCF